MRCLPLCDKASYYEDYSRDSPEARAGWRAGRRVSSDVVLNADQRARQDVTLPQATCRNRGVTASAPLVRSETAEVGEVLTERQVRELPLNGRNFAQRVYLVPLVTPGQAGESLSGTFNARSASSVNALGS